MSNLPLFSNDSVVAKPDVTTASESQGWFRHANPAIDLQATPVTVDFLNYINGNIDYLLTQKDIPVDLEDMTQIYTATLSTGWLTEVAANALYVKLSGSEMTGLLTLSGNPSTDMHAATKQYVDSRFEKAGGTISGATTIQGVLTLGNDVTLTDAAKTVTLSKHPTSAMHAATKDYVDRAMPSGARLLFANSTAPYGWTQVTDDNANNRMLRVVNTTGNSVGGSDNPIYNDKIPWHTHTFTTSNFNTAHTHWVSGNTGNESNDHTHLFPGSGDTTSPTSGSGATTGHSYTRTTFGASANHHHYFEAYTNSQGGNHNHTGTTDGNASSTWSPRYLDLILCQKS